MIGNASQPVVLLPLMAGLFLAGGSFGETLPLERPIFLIEIPEAKVPASSEAHLNLASVDIKVILVQLLRPEADDIDYGQIYPSVNEAAASRVSEIRPSPRGKIVRIDLSSRPGFKLIPGANQVRILATNHSGRQFTATFSLHTPKGECSGGRAKIVSLQELVERRRSGASDNRLVGLVLDCGVNFRLTDDVKDQLIEAGAGDQLIRAIADPTAPEFASYNPKAMTLKDILSMLHAGIDPDELVEDRGVNFDFSDDVEKELTAAHARGKLLDDIRYMAGDQTPPSKALSLAEILQMLRGHATNDVLFDYVQKRGVRFRWDRSKEQQLREAGANEKLVLAIRTATENYETSR